MKISVDVDKDDVLDALDDNDLLKELRARKLDRIPDAREIQKRLQAAFESGNGVEFYRALNEILPDDYVPMPLRHAAARLA